MSELSVEEKAKRFDEALKIAKDNYDAVIQCDKDCTFARDGIINTFHHMFPELKETEDEKMLQEIKRYIKEQGEKPTGLPNGSVSVADMLAWLEKQDETDKVSYEIAEKEKREFTGDGFIKCYADFQDFKEGESYWLEYAGNDKYNVRSDNLLGRTYHITPCQLYTVFRKQTWLEKQGNNMGISESTKQELKDNLDKALEEETTESWNEFLDEQETAGYVEPKFHVGDWCVDNEDGTIFQIVKVLDNRYTYKTKDGSEYCCLHYLLENDARLWTIQDAKDGDVLANKYGSVFIYAGLREGKTNTVDDYCYVTANHDEFSVEDHKAGYWYYIDELNPATKEQRDLLFSKMKEAGYEWDAEKKELSKVEPKFHVGDWIVFNGLTLYVKEVGKNFYRAYQEDIPDGYYWNIDNVARLWTIEDAKDGDVLATENFIFIFRNIDSDSGVHYYCHYEISKHEDDNQFDIALPQSLIGMVGDSISHYAPATKEQRKTLMKAIADAGYEWDKEKKELNKIEEKPAKIENIEHGKYYYCIKDYYSGGCKRASKGEVVQALRGMNMMVLGVKANEYFIPVKSITGDRDGWNEEDEENLNLVIARLHSHPNVKAEEYDKEYQWLNSLKDRVQAQIKEEWNNINK